MAEAEHPSSESSTNCQSSDDSQASSFSNSSHNQCLQNASKPLNQNHVNHHMPSDSQLPHVSLSCKSFTPCNGTCDEDRSSLASQDSGIPTLEINPPEHIHARVTSAGLVVPPPHDDNPATLNLDVSDNSILKSSTFPRCDFDLVRLYSTSGLSSTAGKGTLNRSDDISVGSVSSLSTEFSATLSVSNEDFLDFMVTSESSAVVTFENEDVLHRSDNSLSSPTDLHGKLSSPQRQPVGVSTPHEARPKRLGPLASFFHKSLFAKRMKDTGALEEQREPGWKLFGKVPHKELSTKDSRKIQKEYERRSEQSSGSISPKKNVRRNLDFEPLSTTALILENRPANLPAKPEEEAQKHRQEYEEMVAQAKKRELKDAQKRKKQLEDRCKLEESIGNAALTWSQEILPNWQSMCSSKRVRDLWWQGLPPSVRGKVWSLAIGNELNITDELYNICLARAKEKWNAFVAPTAAVETETEDAGLSHADREASLELIKLDISRTFPNLCIFQQGGPYHDVLHSILGAYTCYRPDVGYVQGMSFIAAVLILNMDTADAFIAFANLLNKPCQMAFYRVDHSLMLTYFAAFEVFFEENLPKLFAHFKNNNLSSDIYLIDWIFTLYSKSLPLDIACRVWDVFCRDGEEFLFRTALGILRLYEDILTHMDFIHIAQFLTRLPDYISAEEIFSSITTINMNSKNKKWGQVLQALQKGQERGSPLLKR
ncbi:TBC1 domain family member 14 isoform X1 [Labeo rohita]|uniref:TBC1 domain family member 14 isoform X1 n=1 Tax=Labeo rohita TaxID=84645 RepID=UPI0021E22940|nr:TBC1 domain family member 14 isoform X1 [Labeo rohita]XP_050970831.1 TBC1 domain family member 14 isoform X1 [Labeo rohita]